MSAKMSKQKEERVKGAECHMGRKHTVREQLVSMGRGGGTLRTRRYCETTDTPTCIGTAKR